MNCTSRIIYNYRYILRSGERSFNLPIKIESTALEMMTDHANAQLLSFLFSHSNDEGGYEGRRRNDFAHAVCAYLCEDRRFITDPSKTTRNTCILWRLQCRMTIIILSSIPSICHEMINTDGKLPIITF